MGQLKKIIKRNIDTNEPGEHPWANAWADWEDEYYLSDEEYYWAEDETEDEFGAEAAPEEFETPKGSSDSNRRLRHGHHGDQNGNKRKESCCGPHCVVAFGILMTLLFIVHQCFLRKYR